MKIPARSKTRQMPLGVSQLEPIAPGLVVRVRSQPLLVDFTPERLVLPPDVAAAFRVEDAQVLGVSLFPVGSLPIAGLEFIPDAQPRLLAPVLARRGSCLELHVLNTSGAPHKFAAVIVGTVG